MGVDSTNIASGRGRKSVRLTSKATYNHGLIILDLEHMPGSICGTWPACKFSLHWSREFETDVVIVWTVGPDWPNNGEIDIIEGVNTQTHNGVTLHTGPGCSIGANTNTSPNIGSSNMNLNTNGAAADTAFSGSVSTSNCDINAAGQAQNAGCSIATSDKSSYGDGLNSIQGGIYATEWTSDVIKIWYFPRSKVPSNIDSAPDPSSWGTPMASFPSTSCDIDANFKDHQIVFDTTFCGAWAGSVWSQDATCSAKAATCQEFVQNNPDAFTEAFWTINSLKVFTSNGETNNPIPSASRPGTSSILPTNSQAPIASGNPSVPVSAPVPTPKFPQSYSWGNGNGWHTHTRSWGGFGNDHQKGTWRARDVPNATVVYKSAAEPTSTPVAKALPRPVIRAEYVPEDIDLRMVRRHMIKHRRHGSSSR